MKPSILMVANYYPDAGGISASVENLARGLVREGYRAQIHPVGGPLPGRPARYAHLLRIAPQFDLIHAHGCARLGFLPILAGAIAARVHHKALVIEYNDWPTTGRFVTHSPMVKFAATTAHAIVTPSPITADLFRAYPKPVLAIPYVLDLARWPFKPRSRFHPAVICTRPYYARQLTIDAFLLLQKAHPHATLVLCGRGAIHKKLPRHARVSFVGHVPRQYLYPLLSQADVYLNTFAHDSFGCSVHEAIAAGLAVVSVPSPALELQPGPDTITFSDDATPQALARTMVRALYDQAATQRKAEAGRQAVQKLRWKVIFPKWRDLYDQVIATANPQTLKPSNPLW